MTGQQRKAGFLLMGEWVQFLQEIAESLQCTQACPRSQVGCEMWRPGFLQTDNQPETALCTCKVLHPDASLGALPSAPMNELLYSFTDASLGALPLGILVAAFSSTHSHKELSDSWWSLPP